MCSWNGYRYIVVVRILILLIFLANTTTGVVSASHENNSLLLQDPPQTWLYQVDPFLHPPFAKYTGIASIFDHSWPTPFDELNETGTNPEQLFTTWNGLVENCIAHKGNCGSGAGISYDSHAGIDYRLFYSPVYASAPIGEVVKKEWNSPTNRSSGLGLYIKLKHTVQGHYRGDPVGVLRDVDIFTFYGHLSSTNIPPSCETGEIQCPYGTMIGISGNTGSSGGAHLHFEVRLLDHTAAIDDPNREKPVDPYGWAPTPNAEQQDDPWGAFDQPEGLWAELPPTSGADDFRMLLPGNEDLPTGYKTLSDPEGDVNNIIDNSDSTNFSSDACWTSEGTTGFGNSNYVWTTPQTQTPDPGSCLAKWYLPDDKSSGDYDIYVHIPYRDESGVNGVSQWSSDMAIYHIYSGGQEISTQHISQHEITQAIALSSPNIDEVVHSGWVYLGEYYLNAYDEPQQNFVQLGNWTGEAVTSERNPHILADAVAYLPVRLDPPPTPTPSPSPTPTPHDVEMEITVGSDDAGPEPSHCSFSTGWNEVYFGKCDNGTDIYSGFRFTNIQIPSGARITEAHLIFTVDGEYTNNISLAIYGQAAGNPSTFSAESQPISRTLTTASVPWSISSDDIWNLGEERTSPDIKSIVQEVVTRSDWQAGNAMAFIVKNVGLPSGTPLHRRVIGVERLDPPYGSYRTLLIVDYDMSSPLPTDTPIPPGTPSPTFTRTPGPTSTPTPCTCPLNCIAYSVNGGHHLALPMLVEKLYQGIENIQLYYRVRDELLATTPKGRHYIDLYYGYGPEIARILQRHSDLRQEALDTLGTWDVSLQALVDGQGGSTVITLQQVTQTETFLDNLSAVASPQLRQVLFQERNWINFSSYNGMTMDQAWSNMNPDHFLVEQQDYISVSLGWPASTIPSEGFYLDRSTDGQNWERIASLSAMDFRYSDYGLARHTKYWYRLTAWNSQGGVETHILQTETVLGQ